MLLKVEHLRVSFRTEKGLSVPVRDVSFGIPENGRVALVGESGCGKSVTSLAIGGLVDRDRSILAAGGYLIQLMPGADEDTIVKVEGGIMAAGSVSAILERDPDPEHMLRTVMADFDLKILDSNPVEYRCYCSRERVERALISLGADELEGILREQGKCELSCQFCDEVYAFSGEELKELIRGIRES